MLRTPVVLLVVSAGVLGVSQALPGWGDLGLIAGPCVLASLWLLWRAWRAAKPKVIVDGSNVMHWKDGKPQIETLHEVIAELKKRGLDPGVIFDANAGYLVTGRYQDDAELAKSLGLPVKSVLVVPKGSVADETILAAAKALGARVVSNDRFRDWADRHPEVKTKGQVIGGGYRDGALWLTLPDDP